ncbi:SDR family oxidoreductase [Membranihabitans maritimus]|uniref:SDR family oxidoreductase n=1 Tax=Membranihabitans maritimus TaxID=2904244 RepID=UPI001F28798A|nr:SDR family oxidoreductase [Membranihabitans maritimus]
MILITGATGEYGKVVINNLVEKGVNTNEIIALVRDLKKASDLKEKGIELRVGNYNDYDSLLTAFYGVDKLLFVSGSEVENREQQHRNVVNAAKESNIDYVVYTSFLQNIPVQDSAISFLQASHMKTENWIKESGISYTILRNSTYMDMIPMFIGESVLQTGIISLPAGEGKSSSVLREELAEAAANILTSSGHKNKVYSLANNESLSYSDIAKEISNITGQEISYHSPAPDEFTNQLKKYNVPDEYIHLLTAFSLAQAKGELELKDLTLEKILGRKPYTVKEFLVSIYG